MGKAAVSLINSRLASAHHVCTGRSLLKRRANASWFPLSFSFLIVHVVIVKVLNSSNHITQTGEDESTEIQSLIHYEPQYKV